MCVVEQFFLLQKGVSDRTNKELRRATKEEREEREERTRARITRPPPVSDFGDLGDAPFFTPLSLSPPSPLSGEPAFEVAKDPRGAFNLRIGTSGTESRARSRTPLHDLCPAPLPSSLGRAARKYAREPPSYIQY